MQLWALASARPHRWPRWAGERDPGWSHGTDHQKCSFSSFPHPRGTFRPPVPRPAPARPSPPHPPLHPAQPQQHPWPAAPSTLLLQLQAPQHGTAGGPRVPCPHADAALWPPAAGWQNRGPSETPTSANLCRGNPEPSREQEMVGRPCLQACAGKAWRGTHPALLLRPRASHSHAGERSQTGGLSFSPSPWARPAPPPDTCPQAHSDLLFSTETPTPGRLGQVGWGG